MDNILNSITGREKYLIRGNNVLNAITGAVFGVIEDGVVKSPTTGKTVALLTEGGGGSVDLSFITAGSGDILKGKVGADCNGNPVHGTLVPDSGGSSGEMQFYLCTGYDGVVEKVIITAGAITDEMGEPVSLVGEYTIVDPAAVGTARKWYCPQTTASGDYPAYTSGVTIGCADIYIDWDPERGDIYEKKWGIGYGNSVDEYCWLIAPNAGIESPFAVAQWQNNGGYVATAPLLTTEVEDAAPYAPTGWKGRPIEDGGGSVFFSYGAGTENANGFWEQIAGNGLDKQAKWQLIGSDSIIQYDTGGSFSGERWALYARDSNGKMTNMYIAIVDSNSLKHPGELTWENSGYGPTPLPSFVYSESGGYFPTDTIVSGLTYNGKPPKIGCFYNADATIKAERFFPA